VARLVGVEIGGRVPFVVVTASAVPSAWLIKSIVLATFDPQDDGHYAPQVPIQLAAAAVVVGPCSSLHLSQGAAAADAGSTSLAQIHVPQ